MPATYITMSRLWRCSSSCSYSCIWSPHQPPGLFLPPDKHHGDRYSSLVWCLSTRTTTTSECSVVWWMVLPFYQYLIWPMVCICLEHCHDDPPEAAELLDYFDSTYISGRLRQQNPAQNQAVPLVVRHSPHMFPPVIWNVHDATVNGDARTNNMCEGWNNNFLTW